MRSYELERPQAEGYTLLDHARDIARSYRRAAGGGAVWVPSYMGRAVYRIQPRG